MGLLPILETVIASFTLALGGPAWQLRPCPHAAFLPPGLGGRKGCLCSNPWEGVPEPPAAQLSPPPHATLTLGPPSTTAVCLCFIPEMTGACCQTPFKGRKKFSLNPSWPRMIFYYIVIQMCADTR